MGQNRDLVRWMGLPSTLRCPHCDDEGPSWFDDFDLDTPGCNPEPGVWRDNFECARCGQAIQVTVRLSHAIDIVPATKDAR